MIYVSKSYRISLTVMIFLALLSAFPGFLLTNYLNKLDLEMTTAMP